jgi:hypothetical protein
MRIIQNGQSRLMSALRFCGRSIGIVSAVMSLLLFVACIIADARSRGFTDVIFRASWWGLTENGGCEDMNTRYLGYSGGRVFFFFEHDIPFNFPTVSQGRQHVTWGCMYTDPFYRYGPFGRLDMFRCSESKLLGISLRKCAVSLSEAETKALGSKWEWVRFSVPIWHVTLLASLAPALFAMRLYFGRCRRTNSGHCAHCGYDISVTPHRCPECGLRTGSAKGSADEQ